jgi:dihydrolipoamide dehydrogenase
VGDCNGLCLLAHAASAQAEIAMGKQVNLNVVPSAVFTAPECAMVGLTEEQCLQQELNFKVGKAMFHGNGKALAMNQPEGLIKVIVDTNSNRLLGAHICGPHAADLITEAALAMSAKVDVATFASTIHPHPTLSEALHQAIASNYIAHQLHSTHSAAVSLKITSWRSRLSMTHTTANHHLIFFNCFILLILSYLSYLCAK